MNLQLPTLFCSNRGMAGSLNGKALIMYCGLSYCVSRNDKTKVVTLARANICLPGQMLYGELLIARPEQAFADQGRCYMTSCSLLGQSRHLLARADIC